MSDSRQAVVIGAGIVGVCCALQLQRAGFAVRVFDPNPPGTGASMGNAGILSTAAVIPQATPGILRAVPKMLIDPEAALKIRWPDLWHLLPWLARFVANGTPERGERISQALAAIVPHAIASYEPLLADAGEPGLIRRGGYVEAYRSAAGFAGAATKSRFRAARGVTETRLDRTAIAALEPALAPEIGWGVLLPESGFTVSPLRLTRTLAALVERGSGIFDRRSVTGFADWGPQGPRQVIAGGEGVPAGLIVLAIGARSARLARALGSPMPLIGQRGYHALLPRPGVTLQRPVVAGEAHMVMTPMEHGLCLTGTLELAGLDAAPDYGRAVAMVREVPRWLPGVDLAEPSFWMGHRPAMPDSLPVIGRSPRYRNVLFAFGHGAMGLTLGAVTGRLIAETACDTPPLIDLHPFRPDRF